MTITELTSQQSDRLEAIEAAPPAPESFDAVAACRRVLALADAIERGELGAPLATREVAAIIRVAVHDSAAALLATAGEN